MRHVETHKKLSIVSTGGLCTKDMEGLLKDFIPKAYRVAAHRPFRRPGDIGKEAFLQAIKDYLEGGKGRAVIAYLITEDWDHWTVVKGITPKGITLFDSASMNRLRKDRCRIGLKEQRGLRVFVPSRAFFLWSTDRTDSGKGSRRRP
jgi:hypothetical protein